MIEFRPVIDLGNIVVAGSALVFFVGTIYTLRGDVRALKIKADSMERELTKITEVLVNIGRQEERLNALNQRQDEADRRIDILTYGKDIFNGDQGEYRSK